ncbi:AMP-binding protein [Micromonospora eburnea]|uniref:Acyl-CoA synthetase (AMP-forming)/AMP-acid ligase II n=1 Tax=Micromonospora eburnea TaxID=227316 RepID=A0A1C6VL28_9ACTN|nr:AMP-binding protein [Micromonospora eburnea]SCL66600.1 Acyl-CoA synthetase (AMP-forming)/AMP-acid ligase II [Micromonospora eburnea]
MPTRSFCTAFREQVRGRPDAPALFWAGRQISYRDLAHLVVAAERALADLALDPELPLCVPAVKSPETIALLIAAFAADRRVLLPSASLGSESLTRLSAEVGCAHILRATPDGLTVRASGADGRRLPGAGLLLTTSGSTGTPKVVDLAADGVDAFLAWAGRAFRIGPDARVLNYAPLNFDLCLLDVWAALAAGACVELVDPDRAVDGAWLAELCRDRKPTVVQAVPLFFRLVTEAGGRFPWVRDVLLTGDVVPLALLDRITDAFPNARLWNVYGCTETNDSFLCRVDPDEVRAQGAMPIGHPIDGVEVSVLDADGAEVTGAGTGELVVRTPFRARGYLDARLDAERWRDGWFRTGDLVRRDASGAYFLTGRNDHQVKVRGVRTNLQEVEQVVLAHPGVLEAAVVAVPDSNEGNVLLAVVRPTPASGVNGLHLRLHCAAALPRTAIPGAFELVDEALPRTSTGKVDRNALRARRGRALAGTIERS